MPPLRQPLLTPLGIGIATWSAALFGILRLLGGGRLHVWELPLGFFGSLASTSVASWWQARLHDWRRPGYRR